MRKNNDIFAELVPNKMSSSEDDYAYEYSDDESGSVSGSGSDDDPWILIENAFYEADDIMKENPAESLSKFIECITLEEGLGDEVKWRFKALQQVVILSFRLKDYEGMKARYRQLLGLVNQVTSNECTDSINRVLDAISTTQDNVVLADMFDCTLQVLRDSKNERMWFNTNLKLGKVYLAMIEEEQRSGNGAATTAAAAAGAGAGGGSGSGGGGGGGGGSGGLAGGQYIARLRQLLEELHSWCSLEDGGGDNTNKGSQLLEVYALKIQLCTLTGNSSELKTIYPRTLRLHAAVQDPRIMGVIRESGGKMFMRDRQWEEAYNEFYASFRFFQEAGNPRAKDVLKYAVLANMLSLNPINPFDSPEAKVYKDNPEITAMVSMRSAYESNDITEFERILKDRRARLTDDAFLKSYTDDLLKNIRCHVLQQMVRPYTNIRLSFLASRMNVSSEQVEALLVQLLLDKRVQGRIDQSNGVLVLENAASASARRYQAVDRWVQNLENLQRSLHSGMAL